MTTTFDPNQTSPQISLSTDLLTATYTATYATQATARATSGFRDGDHQVSFTFDVVPTGDAQSVEQVGLQTPAHTLYSGMGDSSSIAVFLTGDIEYNGFIVGPNIGAIAQGDVVTIRFKDGKAYFRRNNGPWNADSTANPDTGTGGIDLSFMLGTDITVFAYPAAFTNIINSSVTGDFSQWEQLGETGTPPPASNPQFVVDVHDFGAKGDAVSAGDGVVANGNTLSSASYTFTAADVGKELWIDNTARSIQSVSNGVATFNPGGASNGSSVAWLAGTDDTAAIASAISHAEGMNGVVGAQTSSGGFTSGGLPQGATVQLRSGYGYMVSNSQTSFNGGTPGCIVLPRRVGFQGSGDGFYTTAIHVKPNSYGHAICNQNPGPNGYVDFLTISNLVVFCNGGWSPGQLDGVHLEIAFNGYNKVDACNRVQHVQVYDARQDGFMFAGRGESVFEDISSQFAGRYGMFFNGLSDTTVIRANAGGAQKTGMRIYRCGACRFIGCKAFFSGASGGTDPADSANWHVSADDTRNGLAYFTNCEGQESRGSSWVIESGLNIFDAVVAADPGRVTNPPLDTGTLPSPIAGFHLRGANARMNTFCGCEVHPSVAIFNAQNWGHAGDAVHIDDFQSASGGPQANRGDIYTFVPTTNPDGTTLAGINYPAGSGPKGGPGTTNGKNTLLRVDGQPCT
jgi:hypothetical protein